VGDTSKLLICVHMSSHRMKITQKPTTTTPVNTVAQPHSPLPVLLWPHQCPRRRQVHNGNLKQKQNTGNTPTKTNRGSFPTFRFPPPQRQQRLRPLEVPHAPPPSASPASPAGAAPVSWGCPHPSWRMEAAGSIHLREDLLSGCSRSSWNGEAAPLASTTLNASIWGGPWPEGGN
jgi:hypothetical protein